MKKTRTYEEQTHFLGRVFAILAIIVIMSVPLAICLKFDATPPWNSFFLGLIGVISIYLPVAIIEFITFVPMLGTGSAYLIFVTGNITNLKVPCALNALDVVDAKPGSDEAEVISTISVAISAMVTDVIIIIGVVGISFIMPILEAPQYAPAFNNVLPALFGALGVVWIRKYWKISIVPCIVMLLVFTVVSSRYTGLLIPVGSIIAIITARILYKKGII